ncbi:MAG: helix-turn-helix domain-containing protein [Enterococcus sp.]
MNQLFFKLHDNKQLHRQLNILYYLKRTGRITSISELIETVICTPPTLRSDVQVLNELLPSKIRIIHIPMIGYQLSFPETESLDTYVFDLVKETITYKLINQIFYGHIQSFETMCQTLHVSNSVLRKAIQHMNQVLKTYHLQLSTNPIDLVGEETDIRYFLFEFYVSFRKYIPSHSLSPFIQETYEELLSGFHQEHQPKLHINYFRSTLWMSILKERWLRHKTVTIKQATIEEIQSRKSFTGFSLYFMKHFKNKLGIAQLSRNELIWVYIVTLHCVSYIPEKWQADRSNLVYHYPEDQPVKALITQHLLKITTNEFISEETIDQISTYLANLRLLATLSNLFETHSLFIEQLKSEEFIRYHDAWRTWLTHPFWQSIYSMIHINEVATTLSLFQLVQATPTETKTIICSFQGDAGYEYFLTAQMQSLVPQQIQPIFLFNEPLTSGKAKQLSACLIICNYDLEAAFPCEVIQLSAIPTKEEWQHLQKYLVDLSWETSVLL